MKIKKVDYSPTEPGIYEVSNELYHSGPGVSSSQIGSIIKSPAHYRARLLNPLEKTEPMIIGSAVHCKQFDDPSVFAKLFCSLPAFEAKTKDGSVAKNPWATAEGKAFKAKFEEENKGKQLLTKEQVELVDRIALALKAKITEHPKLAGLFQGHREVSFYWRDEATGVLCKCRPDTFTPFGIITDLKVLENADFDSFQYTLAKSLYYVSAAFYIEGVTQALKQAGELEVTPPDSFVFVCVEKEAPNAVAKYECGPNSLTQGRRVIREALNKIAECERTGKWPEYPEEIQTIELPNWSFYKAGVK